VTEQKGACCSSPAAMCYWFAASLIAGDYLASSACIGVLSMRCLPLRSFTMAIGCVANWLRNRTLHCAVAGPLFLIAAAVFLLSDVTVVHVNNLFVRPFVLMGVGIAFLLDWRYAQRSAS
jgi:hypothetical protein